MANGPDDQAIYVVDASSWISIEGHPKQNVILFCLSVLIENGRLICPREAWREVQRCPWVKAWLDQYRKKMVRNIADPAYLRKVGEVTHRFPAMSKPRGRRERADQYVVAMASYLNIKHNPQPHVVVANETGLRRRSRKIPAACDELGIECLTILEMLSREFPGEEWE